jgi:4-carboxymuconolactone decarboxylase
MSANTVDPDETTAVRRRRGEDVVPSLSGGARPASLDGDFPFLANSYCLASTPTPTHLI